MKTPLEFVICAVRAMGATIENPMAIARTLRQIGEPLYGAQPPTGYSDVAATWVNTGALMNRLNFALRWPPTEFRASRGSRRASFPRPRLATRRALWMPWQSL